MRKPLFQNLPIGLKFLLALLLCIMMLMTFGNLGNVLAEMITGVSVLSEDGNPDFHNPEVITSYRIVNTCYNLGGFGIGAILFAWFCTINVKDYFHVRNKFRFKYIWVILACFFLSIPSINLLSIINEMFQSTDYLQEVQQDNFALRKALINRPEISTYLINLLTMALVPALGEELFFRGVIMRLTYQGTRKIHVAVLLSSLLFALFHFEIDNLLPITFMGVVMGYLYVYTGSLLIPIILHFLNNAIYITLQAYANDEVNQVVNDGGGALTWIISGLVCLGVLLWMLKRSDGKERWPAMLGSLMRD